jgi:hypothetical protein
VRQKDLSERNFGLLLAELDKLRTQFTSRDSNMNTRALVLIGSSAILTATGVVRLTDWLQVVAVALVLAAVVLGIIAIRSSGGDQVSISGLADKIKCESDARALEIIYKSKLAAYTDDRVYLKHRGKLVNAGFVVLAAGILLSLVSLLIEHSHQLGL